MELVTRKVMATSTRSVRRLRTRNVRVSRVAGSARWTSWITEEDRGRRRQAAQETKQGLHQAPLLPRLERRVGVDTGRGSWGAMSGASRARSAAAVPTAAASSSGSRSAATPRSASTSAP